ncbi:MAG: glycosyltransferase family 9 protein [Bryobacteraceae bacterium]|nr:glycosyltransferase family 9 protein [Bryobacteraceae bacterium]
MTKGSIIVVRALPGLGDFLCAVPALRALRQSRPESHIALLGAPGTEKYVARFPHYIDEFIPAPPFPGVWMPPGAETHSLPAFLTAIHQRRFDLALQMHGSGLTSNALTLLLEAQRTAGFYPRRGWRPPAPHRFFLYPETEPEIRRNLLLLEQLDLPSAGEDLELPLFSSDHAELESLAVKLPDGYVCLHPGAKAASRRWPPERFAAVGDVLARHGFPVVLTGSADDAPVNAAVARLMRYPALDLARPMGPGALALVLRGARLLVANDTGVSHLAVALKLPSVVIFSAGDPQRWAPLDEARHRSLFAPVDCRPCDHAVCPIGHPCANSIGVEEVTAAALDLLRRRVAPHPDWTAARRVLAVNASPPAAAHLERTFESVAFVSTPPPPEIQSSAFDAAIVFTGEHESPYSAAYQCYLARIPLRAGLTAEFGGGVLTDAVPPPSSHLSREERHMYLLEALGIALPRTSSVPVRRSA